MLFLIREVYLLVYMFLLNGRRLQMLQPERNLEKNKKHIPDINITKYTIKSSIHKLPTVKWYFLPTCWFACFYIILLMKM